MRRAPGSSARSSGTSAPFASTASVTRAGQVPIITFDYMQARAEFAKTARDIATSVR